MRLSVYLILVGGLLSPMFADARPWTGIERQRRELNRRDIDCVSLARLADKALNFVSISISSFESPARLRDYSERIVGINMFNPNEMHRVVCRLSEVSTLRGLKDALNDLGVILQAATSGYNMGVAAIPVIHAQVRMHLAIGWDKSEEVVFQAADQAFAALNASHLVGFDPEGTRWMLDNVFAEPFVDDEEWPSQNTAENVDAEALCNDLMGPINTILDFWANSNVFSEVEYLTGVDLNDRELVRDLACSLTGATSIRDLVGVMDNFGIVNHVLVERYMLVTSQLKDILEMYEYESDGDTQAYTSVYEQQAQEAQNAREAVFHPVLTGMNEIGLLDLENDLTG